MTTRKSQGKEDLRCDCGNLLARVAKEGIELKCKRCKRLILVPFSELEGFETFLEMIRQEKSDVQSGRRIK